MLLQQAPQCQKLWAWCASRPMSVEIQRIYPEATRLNTDTRAHELHETLVAISLHFGQWRLLEIPAGIQWLRLRRTVG